MIIDNKCNVLYSRVSSKGQQENTSLDYQKTRLTEYCKSKDISNLTFVADVDSGSNNARKGIKQIEHLIKSGIVDTIYITKLDRLYRTVLGGARFIHLCLKHKVDIQATDEPISTKSPVEMLQINLLLSIAEFERSNIINRTKQGKQSSFNAGQRAQGNIPLGYKSSSNGMIIDNSTASIVDKIFRRFNKTKSVSDVKHYLNKAGYTTARNKPFNRIAIYRILKNPTYAGFISFAGNTKLGNHQPIISKRLFNSVNKSF